MEITINFPDDLGKQIIQIPDVDAFISNIVKEAICDLTRSVLKSVSWHSYPDDLQYPDSDNL